jgi:hypothetical protein
VYFVYQVVKSMEQKLEKLTLLLAGQELSNIVLSPTVLCCFDFVFCIWVIPCQVNQNFGTFGPDPLGFFFQIWLIISITEDK